LPELPLPSCPKGVKSALGMFPYYAGWIKNFSAEWKPLTSKRLNSPLQNDAVSAFKALCSGLVNASLVCLNDYEPFTVDCDASDFAIAAILNYGG